MNRVIGVDFDNTLVCYDDVFLRLGREAGLKDLLDSDRQKAIREAARRSPEGDLAWQRLQGQAYGPRIQEAKAFEGALAFLIQCQKADVTTWIISHKTQYAGIDPTHTDLRQAASEWMVQKGFFSPETGLEPRRFLFGATRQEKIEHIRAQGCTHFVDDLEETFREEGFPKGVQGILFTPASIDPASLPPHLWVCSTWQEIQSRIFHA